MSAEPVYDWAQLDSDAPEPVRPVLPITPPTSGRGYAQAALADELRTLLGTTEGSRNDALNLSAFNLGTLVGAGLLDEGLTGEALEEAGLAIGLTKGETVKTTRSGLRKGMLHPRQVKPLGPTLGPLAGVAPLGGTPQAAPGGPYAGDFAAPVPGPQTGGPQAQGGPLAALPAGAPGGPVEGAAGAPADQRARTSWWPQSIGVVAASAAAVQPPTHLWRDDGACLLYSGKVNGLLGESESGKTWVALKALADALLGGERCLMLDFEDSAGGIAERLRAMGVDADALALLDYASPDEALGLAQSEDLSEALGEKYGLILCDGVNAAMTLLGYDLNSNTDATLFSTKLLRPLARTGAAVVTVDHVPKNSEQRGKGGIGAQAKRAMMDGCALTVEVVEPFGKGQSGILKLTVDKDRPGYVRGVSAGGKAAGRVMLESTDTGVSLRVLAPDLRAPDARGPFRPTGLMEKVSRYLEGVQEPLGANAVAEAMGGKRTAVLAALAALVEDGYVEVTEGPRRSKLHAWVNGYRQAEDPRSDTYTGGFEGLVPTGSRVVPGNHSATGSLVPSPYRGGTSGNLSEPPSEQTPAAALVPDGYAHCNGCGELTAEHWLAEGQGYCVTCSRARR